MTSTCAECGGRLLNGDTCRDNFHALLLPEAQVPDAAGSIIHFYTVACYVLQHPDGMNFTAEALQALKANLGDALDGRATVDDFLRRARYAAGGSTRVTRRPGDLPVSWRLVEWDLTIADMLSVIPSEYAASVILWARSIRDLLAAGTGKRG